MTATNPTRYEIIKWQLVVIYLIYFGPLFFNLKMSTIGQNHIKDATYTYLDN
jgi:hypothetical protein